jgi:hypothetical protein
MPLAAASSASPPNLAQFQCDAGGYVRHWVVAGPQAKLYTGHGGNEGKIYREALDTRIIQPPRDAALAASSPVEGPWRFYEPGENIFVECSHFYHNLTVLDYYAATEIHVSRAGSCPARLWAAGLADLWVNDVHVSRLNVPRSAHVNSMAVTLPLQSGANRLCVRLQAIGARDTRMLFGLQILKGAAEVQIKLPGPEAQTAQLVAAERWLRSVKSQGNNTLAAGQAAPVKVSVRASPAGRTLAWPQDQSQLDLPAGQTFQAVVTLAVAGQKLERLLEIPANQPPAPPPAPTLQQHRRAYQEHIAGAGQPAHDVQQLMARRLMASPSAADTPAIEKVLPGIEARRDCSDFILAALLRMYAMKLLTGDEEAQVKRVALAFRYWNDEPGTDAMCFESENHALLFHGCQLIAGRLFPDDRFANSGRKGTEQAALGARRCGQWLDRTEQYGLVEYFSSTYMPLTVAALMNVVDLSGDAALSRRAGAVADHIFLSLATQCFDGVTVAPQGRVYRNVLYPQSSGTQALLSFATNTALVSYTNWIVFLASSKSYHPPAGLELRMSQPYSGDSREAGVIVRLNKTPAYLLTSLAIPGPAGSPTGKNGQPPVLIPGQPGYQQHLWHATLGRDCHVFVNHPGASFDQSESRPGYWYGNGVLPRLEQHDGLLLETFDVPDSHPIGFTHAHWPADVFDRQELCDHWVFGIKGQGAIALWCSAPLQPYDDVLCGRELRAAGRRVAWLCVCGSVPGAGGMDAFQRSCRALAPTFDPATGSLGIAKK